MIGRDLSAGARFRGRRVDYMPLARFASASLVAMSVATALTEPFSVVTTLTELASTVRLSVTIFSVASASLAAAFSSVSLRSLQAETARAAVATRIRARIQNSLDNLRSGAGLVLSQIGRTIVARGDRLKGLCRRPRSCLGKPPNFAQGPRQDQSFGRRIRAPRG